MGLTPTEVEVLKDKVLNEIAQPQSEQFAERSVSRGSVADRIRAAEFLEAQVAKASKRRIRVTKAYAK